MNHSIQPFSPLDLVPNLLAAGTFLGAIAFVAIYATFANWRLTGPGRALMYWVGSFALLVLMNTIHLATGRYPGIEFVRIFIYGLLFFTIWQLVWTLIRTLRAGKPITIQTFIDRRTKEKQK